MPEGTFTIVEQIEEDLAISACESEKEMEKTVSRNRKESWLGCVSNNLCIILPGNNKFYIPGNAHLSAHL